MATINTILQEALYDLRDPNGTNYNKDGAYAEMLSYANRSLRQLDNVLSAAKSDWVYTQYGTTLSSGSAYVAAPTGCMVVRSMWISSDELTKVSPEYIYIQQKYITTTGRPKLFAELGTNLIFEYTTDAVYNLYIYYDKRATALALGSTMPYNSEFDDLIREMIIILCLKRNEGDIFSDSQIYNFIYDRVFGNIIRRRHLPRRKKLDF